MKINCIIVDDEPASREVMEKYIGDCPSLFLLKSCKNAFEASDAINAFDVQLIFLDINMPKLSGINFYKSLVSPPFVIFTTAYPEFAVEGFELDAIDYLLKPFPFERFYKAANKAIEVLGSRTNESKPEEFVLWKADKKIYRILLGEINYLEAIGDYVKVQYAGKFIMVHSTFQKLLAQLPEDRFIRVHKSFAIALNKLEAIEGNCILMKGKTIPIGQTYRSDFMELINKLGLG
ncbi:LytTR family DNA-binding domain-containing protein [Flammeovirgaceae bacterium SG7u.111]|nr:LytTR family DNA-binding domain-containing protein [Flammeovirgaceae bacterium SG7u.132]WPO35145.1 LytTR family DNA-binding domain-containing protein [Flammeovirgaceae bacterium SG7u.111]